MDPQSQTVEFFKRFPSLSHKKEFLFKFILKVFSISDPPSNELLMDHGFSWFPNRKMVHEYKVKDVSTFHLYRMSGYFPFSSDLGFLDQDSEDYIVERTRNLYPQQGETVLYTTLSYIDKTLKSEDSDGDEGDILDPTRKTPYVLSCSAHGFHRIGRFDPELDCILEKHIRDCCRSCIGRAGAYFEYGVEKTKRDLELRLTNQ